MATTKSKPKPKHATISVHADVANEFRKLAMGRFPKWNHTDLMREMCATWKRKQLRNGN